MQVTVLGVLVMVKSVSLEEADWVAVKKAVVLDSGRALTSMVTPVEGRAELIVTRRVKGPAEGASVDPEAGVELTDNVACEVHGSAPFLLQKGVQITIIAKNERIRWRRFMSNRLIRLLN